MCFSVASWLCVCVICKDGVLEMLLSGFYFLLEVGEKKIKYIYTLVLIKQNHFGLLDNFNDILIPKCLNNLESNIFSA